MARARREPQRVLALLHKSEQPFAAYRSAATVLCAAAAVRPSPPGLASFVEPDHLVSEAEAVAMLHATLQSLLNATVAAHVALEAVLGAVDEEIAENVIAQIELSAVGVWHGGQKH